jgi:hypothetical protein
MSPAPPHAEAGALRCPCTAPILPLLCLCLNDCRCVPSGDSKLAGSQNILFVSLSGWFKSFPAPAHTNTHTHTPIHPHGLYCLLAVETGL